MLDPGQILQNRYRIDDLLGEGGMGAVYKAWDTRLKVPVALKEMTPQPGLDEHTLDQLRQQFEQEATILARLNHPHLVRVGDYFQEGGNTYLVMDFVEGESLINLIKEKGALPEARVLTWALQLLDALTYCHKQGVIHRDVKPQNVIITSEGRAVLVDFGLVKLWDPDDPHTKTAMRGVGTPEYAPPEQYSAQEGHTDPRSDLYGLAATTYHALAGEPPLGAAERMSDPEQFIPVRELAPDVSPRTSIAVMKAMALARSQRWQSAEEMAEALIEGETAPLQPTPERPVIIEKPAAPTQTRELPKGEKAAAAPAKRRWIWIAAAVLILPALAAGWWLYQSGLLTGGTEAVQATQSPAATEVAAETDVPRPTTNPTVTPLPTITPTPRPSASDKARAFAEAILAAIGDRPPDYADDFSDPGSGWTLMKTSDIEAGYQEGEYAIVTSPGYSTSSDSMSLPALADFALEVDGRFVSGETGYWGVSWYWGDNQITGILIPPSGQVQLVHCAGEDCSSLGDIRRPALNPTGKPNHLQVIVKGSEIAIAINGEWQVLATDLYYTTPGEGRRIRLEIQNNGSAPLEARWDNLQVWDITELPAPTPTD
jgi:serine/threonine protein kinase